MQVEGQGSRFLRGSDRTGGNQDGGREDRRFFGLANSKRRTYRSFWDW